MKLFPNINLNSTKNLTSGIESSVSIPLRSFFYGDNLTLEIYPHDGAGNFPTKYIGAQFKVALGNLDATPYLEATVTHNTGNYISFNLDLAQTGFEEVTRGLEQTNIKLEIKVIYSTYVETITQVTGILRNQMLVEETISLTAPSDPSNLAISIIPIPSVPSNIVVDTTPLAPSSVVGVLANAPRIPLAPSEVEAELFIETEEPLAPTIVAIETTPSAPVGTIFSHTLLPWNYNGTTVYVPQAYQFEGTGRFAGLNTKVFAWDGTTLENNAPVYNCNGSSCVTQSGGLERIYARNVYTDSDIIEWRLYHNATGGPFDGDNTTLGLASNLFPINPYNLSFYETSVSAETIKFIPASLRIPTMPSRVEVETKPAMPSLVNALEVYYNYYPEFDPADFWDGENERVILLLPVTLTGAVPTEYPTGSILETIGVASEGYPVRVQDPANPRVYPYTVANQNTGSWTWLEQNKRGITWEFITTSPYPDDPIRRYHDEIVLEVSQLNASQGIELNGKYEKIGVGWVNTNYSWQDTGKGANTPDIYRKRIEADCTEAEEAVFLYKREEQSSDFIVSKWEFATHYPPTQGWTSLGVLETRNAEFGGGLTADNPNAWSQSWGTQLTDSQCPLRPLVPSNIIAIATPASPTNITAEIPAVEVYILAGQSNAHGHAPVNSLSIEQGTQDGYFYTSWHNSTSNASTTQYYSNWANQVIAGFTKGEDGRSDLSLGSLKFGPEIGFINQANAIGLAPNKVGILKHAIGASTLADDPNDPTGGLSDWDITATGDRRGDALRAWKLAIADGINKASTAGINIEVKGMIWWQGESGSSVSGLEALIDHMRTWLSTNNYISMPKNEFPVVITKIGYGVDLTPVATADNYIGIVDSSEFGHTSTNNHVGSLDDGNTDQTGNGINDMYDIGQAYANEMARAKLGQAKVRWQPTEIPLRYWLDASDSSKIITSNGLVTDIAERSGNGPTLTSGSNATIEYINDAQNGQSVLRFGANDFTNAVSGLNFTANAKHTWFLVLNPTNIDNQLDSWLTIQGTQQFILMGLSGTNFKGTMYNNGGGSLLSCSSDDLKDEFNIFEYEYDIPNHQQSSLLNGNEFITDQSNTHLVFSNSNIRLNKYVQEAEGDWGEIIFAENITDDVREKIEGYLAHKWGLTTKLPSSHAYKTIPPIEDTTPNAISNIQAGIQGTVPSTPSNLIVGEQNTDFIRAFEIDSAWFSEATEFTGKYVYELAHYGSEETGTGAGFFAGRVGSRYNQDCYQQLGSNHKSYNGVGTLRFDEKQDFIFWANSQPFYTSWVPTGDYTGALGRYLKSSSTSVMGDAVGLRDKFSTLEEYFTDSTNTDFVTKNIVYGLKLPNPTITSIDIQDQQLTINFADNANTELIYRIYNGTTNSFNRQSDISGDFFHDGTQWVFRNRKTGDLNYDRIGYQTTGPTATGNLVMKLTHDQSRTYNSGTGVNELNTTDTHYYAIEAISKIGRSEIVVSNELTINLATGYPERSSSDPIKFKVILNSNPNTTEQIMLEDNGIFVWDSSINDSNGTADGVFVKRDRTGTYDYIYQDSTDNKWYYRAKDDAGTVALTTNTDFFQTLNSGSRFARQDLYSL